VKLQWKPDWGMRWAALGVDYEMSGKDLIDSVKLSSQICRILGGAPPEGFNYELFLDVNGEKISKSKGNGLTMEDWLRYGAPESLAYYVFGSPKSAKRLHFDVIPRAATTTCSSSTPTPARRRRSSWRTRSGTCTRRAARSAARRCPSACC
jgi:lysyl-tRNA synthetase class 1